MIGFTLTHYCRVNVSQTALCPWQIWQTRYLLSNGTIVIVKNGILFFNRNMDSWCVWQTINNRDFYNFTLRTSCQLAINVSRIIEIFEKCMEDIIYYNFVIYKYISSKISFKLLNLISNTMKVELTFLKTNLIKLVFHYR